MELSRAALTHSKFTATADSPLPLGKAATKFELNRTLNWTTLALQISQLSPELVYVSSKLHLLKPLP